RMVRLYLLFHLRLDLLEIVWRNAVGQIDIIIETILDRRPGGELRLGPYLQDRSREDVRRGMAQTFDVRHLHALVWCFAVFVHKRPVKLTKKGRKDTKNLLHRNGSAAAFYFRMRRISQCLLAVVLTATGCHQKVNSPSEFAAERQRMVEEQLKPRGIHDERVLAAMAKVPREEFVPENLRGPTYAESALP